MKKTILEAIQHSIHVKEELLSDAKFIGDIQKIAEKIIECYRQDGKVLFCGNGGSAADAQHLAAELSGRFYFDRPPLYAEALHVNSSYLTAVANDYSYEEIFARLVKGMGRKGDILVGISTSGNSANILKALAAAKSKEMITIGFTGTGGGKMKEMCNYLLAVPSADTPRIQESHIMIGHIICQLVESELFSK
jgi:D-sedoheptulose 7-phosphate isomerase